MVQGNDDKDLNQGSRSGEEGLELRPTCVGGISSSTCYEVREESLEQVPGLSEGGEVAG